MYYVPLLSPTWPGRWHCVDSLHPNTQGGGGPGSHRHLKETDTENKTEQQQCCSEVVGSVILCFLKLCYFNIFMPSECQGLVLESTLSTAHTHMWAGSQEHLLVFSKQTHIQAALVSLKPFSNISWLEVSFSPLIFIAINYYYHNATQASSNVQMGTEPPKSKQQLFKAHTLQCTEFR